MADVVAPAIGILPGDQGQKRLERRIRIRVQRPRQSGMALGQFVGTGKHLEQSRRRGKSLPVKSRLLQIQLDPDRDDDIRLGNEHVG